MEQEEPIEFNIQPEDQAQSDFQNRSGSHAPQELESLKSEQYRHYRSKLMLLKMVLCYNLSSFYIGYSLMYFNAIPYIKIHQLFNIAIDQGVGQGLFSGLIQFGAVFGAISTIYIFKHFTRRQTFLLANTIAFFAGIMVIVEDMRMLLIGRFLQGLCVGVYSTITPLMVRELVPIEISGLFGSFFMPSIVLGSLLAYVFPAISPDDPEKHIKLTFGFTLITVIIQTFLLLFIYKNETPKYLLLKDKVQEARKLIKEIYRQTFQELILEQKINTLRRMRKQDGESQLSKSNRSSKIKPKQDIKDKKQLQNNHKQEANPPTSEKPLNIDGPIVLSSDQFQPNQQVTPPSLPVISQSDEYSLGYLKQIPIARFLAFQLQIFQQFTGIYVIGSYGRQLVKYSLPKVVFYLPIFLNLLRLIASLCGIYIISKYGRKKTMFVGTIVVLIALIGFCIGFTQQKIEIGEDITFLQVLIMISFILFTCAYSSTTGPITYLYVPQIVQPPTLPYTSCVSWLCAYLMVFLFPIIRYSEQKQKNNLTGSRDGIGLFIFFAISTAIHLILIYKLMIETKYQSEMSIRKSFKKIKLCQKLSQYYSESHPKQQLKQQKDRRKQDNNKNIQMVKEEELKM